MKRRVFVLEDDEQRQNWFLKRFFGHVVDIAPTAAEGVTLLNANRYDAIFLDHDLSPEHSAGLNHDDGKTGYDVAWHLARHPQRNALTVVHSMNPSGSKRMVDLLRDHGATVQYLPFPQLRRSSISMG